MKLFGVFIQPVLLAHLAELFL